MSSTRQLNEEKCIASLKQLVTTECKLDIPMLEEHVAICGTLHRVRLWHYCLSRTMIAFVNEEILQDNEIVTDVM